MSDIRDAFRTQARACAGLGSPFMGRLMALCADRLAPGTAVAEQVLGWPGEVGPSGDSVPLRLAGALHGLVRDGTDAGLAAVYPPTEVPDATLWAAVEAAFAEHEARLLGWLDSPPQTNEVRRSAALLAAAAWIGARFPLPFDLSELGASAGLNLSFDRFALSVGDAVVGAEGSPVRLSPEWRGPVPAARPLRVEARAGVDLNPLDPRDPGDRLRLLAYLWPDQPERLRLTEAAIALAGPRPDAGDAADWLEARLSVPRPGRVHMVYHTIAWQYFPPATQARCRAALAAAGAQATEAAPLAHVGMEADAVAGRGAALTVTLWPGGERRELARVDFHGRWIEWHG
jgi:hypothetical protein